MRGEGAMIQNKELEKLEVNLSPRKKEKGVQKERKEKMFNSQYL